MRVHSLQQSPGEIALEEVLIREMGMEEGQDSKKAGFSRSRETLSRLLWTSKILSSPRDHLERPALAWLELTLSRLITDENVG
ncbi:hypothetical protein M513_11463 [Trichuris suis]|uniref:Uncharacterized protein n=1 Tax=Trichuris suis TaxID=68888 RepID=A0A085LRS6_9BILA|nr:hypothetical protein M513_11463 [Trichuris suis]